MTKNHGTRSASDHMLPKPPSLKDRLQEAERRIFEHPAYREAAECRALQSTITDVFLPNWRELLALLEQASTDETLAFELIQNVHQPVVRERFQAVATRRLHNYLASTMSLVDHVRRLMNRRSGPIAEEFEQRKTELLKHPEILFMQNLRNYTMHRTLPVLEHRLSMTNVNTPEQTMESEVELSTAVLLQWDGWSAVSRTFLRSQGEMIELRPVVKQHGELICTFNIWLYTELSQTNDRLDEVNQLITARNAILMGVDPANAERLTKERTALGLGDGL